MKDHQAGEKALLMQKRYFQGWRCSRRFVRCVAQCGFMVALLMGAARPVCAESNDSSFPQPDGLSDSVAFWKRVYAGWSQNEIVFHDQDDLSRIYRVIQVPAHGKRQNGKTRAQTIKIAKKEIQVALSRLQRKRPSTDAELSAVEKEIFNNLKEIDDPKKYKRFRSMRAQNGLRERFEEGYRYAGAFEAQVRTILEENGLPGSLVALAYVESLMNPKATSRSGAVGVWQFMPETGKEYVHVNRMIDERKDPILATEAAAKYINTALKNVGPWPVAITSYNVGRAGMRKVIRAMGTNDLGVIYKKYRRGFFGFAARNYYASFLAVHDVLKNVESHLPGVEQNPAWSYHVVRAPADITVKNLVKKMSIDKNALLTMNPSWGRNLQKSRTALPQGLPIRIPQSMTKEELHDRLHSFGTNKRSQKRQDKTHRVRKGESLWTIARKHGLGTNQLAQRNSLPSNSQIYVGQKLFIPSPRARYSLLPEVRDAGSADEETSAGDQKRHAGEQSPAQQASSQDSSPPETKP